MIAAFAIIGISFGVVLAIFVLFNRLRRPDYSDIRQRDPDRVLLPADRELSVLTWNIGYGALGKDADLYIDGGKSFRALSKPQIAQAAQGIAQTLSQKPWDMICLQEAANAGTTTRNVDVLGTIDRALSNRQRYFWADFKGVLVPRVLHLCHGMATYCAKLSDHCRVIDLPNANTLMLGFINKRYVGLLNRLPISGTHRAWVVINVHLPVFDTTPAKRAAQLDRVFDVATKEYEKGNYVVIAGDWNTRLCSTSFAHATNPERSDYYTDFPQQSLPAGWDIKADPNTPSVRALHAAFKKGQTYTTVFDGFVVSPNVRVSSVKTFDLGFAHSDHQPVEGRFCADL